MATKSVPSSLLQQYPIISDQMSERRLEVILRELEDVLKGQVAGDVVEFGCYSGTTSLFIRRLLDADESDRDFHVYDSFEGLPAKTIEDASVAGTAFKAGELKAPKRHLIHNFKRAGLQLPIIHKGWFEELTDSDLPDHICFGFIDGDFYRSIKDSLQLVWPHLEEGAILVVDDYERSSLPGVSRAVNEFVADHQCSLRHESELAILKF